MSGGREALRRLAAEDPQWIPAVRAAIALTEAGGSFAGASILEELRRQRAARTRYPNFRRLVTFGILERVDDSTRQGRRADYRMPDVDGVRLGLAEFESGGMPRAERRTRLSFTAAGRSGRNDLSAAAAGTLAEDFPQG